VFTSENLQQYNELGFTVVKSVFTVEEISELKNECERWTLLSRDFKQDFFKGNTFFQLQRDINPFADKGDSAEVVLGQLKRITYPYLESPIVNKLRIHSNIIQAIKHLLGNNIVQLVNQVNFNHPGQVNGWGWHQDYRFRKVGLHNFPKSYVQTLIAIDPMTKQNGGVRLIAESFKLGPLRLDQEQETAEKQLDLSKSVTPSLDSGDMILFGPYTVHGSGSNLSSNQRRVFINGYANSNFCDYGLPVLKEGRIVSEMVGFMEYEEDQNMVKKAKKKA
jgi:ectoine hydroxylase-related dioxygenase (phytanoyl-CoA dioxygenase family)